MDTAELIKAGRLDDAWKDLAGRIRAKPGDTTLRLAAFQLLAVRGEWQRAGDQLDALASLDAQRVLFAQVYRPLLNAAALREEVFAGRRTPVVLGEPEPWLGELVQALALLAQGQGAAAARLRDRAFEAAPARAGTIDGQPFAWLADADPRLGPVLEAVVDGGYCWLPLHRVVSITIDAPRDLRDLVWIPATIALTAGTTVGAALPVRYPGSQSAEDALRLARRTDWQDRGDGWQLGLGQRLLASDTGERGLLECREIRFTA